MFKRKFVILARSKQPFRTIFTFSNASIRLYAAIKGVEVRWPEGRPSTHSTVLINDIPASDLPSHIFAVYSDRKQGQVSLYAAHAIIYAPHCSNLRPVPFTPQVIEDDRVTLTIVPLCIPSPNTFPIIQQYLYLRNIDGVLSSLLPTYHASVDFVDLSIYLAGANTAHDLLGFLSVVRGFWSNVTALGIFDEHLWVAIDYAWTTLIIALQIRNEEDSREMA